MKGRLKVVLQKLSDLFRNTQDVDAVETIDGEFVDRISAIGNDQSEEAIVILGYKKFRRNVILCWMFYILTLGLLRLVFYWKPEWMVKAIYQKCRLADSDCVLVKDADRQIFLISVQTACSDDIIFQKTKPAEKATDSNVPSGPAQETSPEATSNGSILPAAILENPASSNFILPTESGGCFRELDWYRYFKHKKVKYVWYDGFGPQRKSHFSRLPAFDCQVPLDRYVECQPLSEIQANQRRQTYGLNEILVKLKPIWYLLLLEMLSPFYVFQAFSVSVWFSEGYTYYAYCVIIMTAVSIVAAVYQTRTNQRALRDTVGSHSMVTVLRPRIQPPHSDGLQEDSQTKTEVSQEELVVCSSMLVPGDIIVVKDSRDEAVLECDAVLLSGTCVVNESMLTGESVPVTKIPIPRRNDQNQDCDKSVIYHAKEHARHTLFCGTQVLQVRSHGNVPVTAVVIRTGFDTAKGQLVRSIMFPKPVDFQFVNDLMRFVGILFVLAAIGFVYTIIIMVERGSAVKSIVLRALVIITIIVPPALPAAMTFGIIAAKRRLKRSQIFCISPNIINTSGAVDCVCFDKTGTLTEDGLGFAGAIPASNGRFENKMESLSQELHSPIVQCLASCHSLAIVNQTLAGDPMDRVLFEATGFSFEDSKEFSFPVVKSPPPIKSAETPTTPQIKQSTRNVEIALLHQYPFSSALQRMSALAANSSVLQQSEMAKPDLDTIYVFSKGSPEAIAALSLPLSIPKNYNETLQQFTSKGFRVLAVAWRTLKASTAVAADIPRSEAEKDLQFLGLIVLENRLKKETKPSIAHLHAADIRTVMVTGDSLETGICVARECGLIAPDKVVYILEASEQPQRNLSFNVAVQGRNQNTTRKYSLAVRSVSVSAENCKAADPPEKGPPSHIASVENGLPAIGSATQSDVTMIPYALALSGTTYAIVRKQFPDLLPHIARSTAVFARMTPDQKTLIIKDLQAIDYIVGMCGDGANDCGALKAANVGISLSEAEASIAAPFTSKQPNIESLVTLIREGRAALVTSFGIFKYMALYSLTQFFSVLILYWIFTSLSDFQFFYQDFFLTTVYALLFGNTDAARVLSKQHPPARILSLASFVSIGLQLGVVAFFQLLTYFLITKQSWFEPLAFNENSDDYYSYEVTAVFLQSIFQYSILAVVYSKGRPFRKIIFNNRLLTLAMIITSCLSIALVLHPPADIVDLLVLRMPEALTFRFLILILAVCNFVVSLLLERLVVDWLILEHMTKRGRYREGPIPKHRVIADEIRQDLGWLQDGNCGTENRAKQGQQGLQGLTNLALALDD